MIISDPDPALDLTGQVISDPDPDWLKDSDPSGSGSKKLAEHVAM